MLYLLSEAFLECLVFLVMMTTPCLSSVTTTTTSSATSITATFTSSSATTLTFWAVFMIIITFLFVAILAKLWLPASVIVIVISGFSLVIVPVATSPAATALSTSSLTPYLALTTTSTWIIVLRWCSIPLIATSTSFLSMHASILLLFTHIFILCSLSLHSFLRG